MLELQPDISSDSWPKWPFVALAIVLFLPGLLIIALAFVAWIKSPQRVVTNLAASDGGNADAVKESGKDE